MESGMTRAVRILTGIVVLVAVGWMVMKGGTGARASGEPAISIPVAELDNAKAEGPEQTAVLAGGCFWGVQGVYQHVRGVREAVSGYVGGEASTATYHRVTGGDTNHAESVQIRFDPSEVSYGEILRIYFSVAHDPTQLDRQGPDVGTQYRSAIFYSDETQKKIAEAYIAQLDKLHVYSKPIATRVDPLEKFYVAEDYHQNYLIEHPRQPYIAINDLPKVENLEKLFPDSYRKDPVRVKTSR